MDSTEQKSECIEGLMYVRCAACGEWMDVKPGSATAITHSLCTECFQTEMRRAESDEPAR